jgi:NAD(P)-dependent dehydrogenase (short-subunit alcohol dehydrogenase family)|tara:strand:+ start:208 stop:1212 length:1005 start_codon:yes stop_codon:yes gene_type:complete
MSQTLHKARTRSLVAVAIVALLAYLTATVLLPPQFASPDPEASAVVVTGASSGIGRAAALELSRRGFIVFAGIRKASDGNALKALDTTGNIRTLQLDVTKPSQISAAVETVEAACKIDGRTLTSLVNNAGVTFKRPLETVEMSRVRQVFDVNYFGVLAVTQAFLPLLRKSQGRIVNVGSVQGVISMPMQGLYASSKFALEALSDTLRLELAPHGIMVSMVNPGYINTAIRGKAKVKREDITAYERREYGKIFDKLAAKAEEHAALAPPCCAMTDTDIVHALTATRPATRYYPATGAVKAGRLFPASVAVFIIRCFSIHPILDHIKDYLILHLVM